MDLNAQKEQFSLAYIRAIASYAGYQVSRPEVDDDSVDGTIIADFGAKPRIEFQAKATARDVIQQNHIQFPLPIKNYNDLCIEAMVPRILIILVMPKKTQKWVNQTDNELCLHHCAYWMSLKGKPTSSNTSSVTVRVPMDNVFNSDQLTCMMQNTEKRGELC